ncbi:MAG: hypothetical protein NZ846_01545 [Thermus sp.]|uniref:hypothetical protein n=1 Tax=unclassified Thermus TaxID=2619321 RepID=UPI000238927A|nr:MULTISPECIES: hypothetical protein [unclassified Thermus]AEV16552.1 hypothetical protein TCCBUS3UF1_15110 [Thermus sp. CCB_US3_UF1]MCS6867545.1 hypothetical protein [Thermus sp.]MCS7217655.1 hypothetical protein [Thermus sp.]MCX7850506.1 hypothetical protein [Thermus sp.]MDW8017132.1 hypothetical protein [Thermus sp.]
MGRRGAWFLYALYLFLTLGASTGVALQLYLMQRQNPSLRADLCQAPGEAREVDHSPLCGLQVAPGLPPLEAPAPPTPIQVLRVRPEGHPGHPPALSRALVPRAPPFALA